ncbi:MAG: DUF559 domain-containing protein [Chloroflexi bacterium]|nr:DUF559 domain-containing protein [Chloroflexota bacterium]
MLSVLCVVAHPDDETILTGGVLAMLAARGAEVHVVCATRGEGGELGEPPVGRAQLGQVREAEMVCAVGKLKGKSLTFFDYVDPTVGPGEELYAFHADLTMFAGQIAASIKQVRPDAVLTHGANGEYGHPAHVLVHTAVKIAVMSLTPALSLWERGDSLSPALSEGERGDAVNVALSRRERESDSPLPPGEGLGVRAKPPLPPELLARCRELRREATDAEKLLWQLLRNRQLNGAKFRRQHPFHGYILDFYCHEAKLAIELDGGGHAEPERRKHDAERTRALQAEGIRVIRFWNDEVLRNTEAVLQVVWETLTDSLTPALSQGERVSDSPLPLGEGSGVRAEPSALYTFAATYPNHPYPRLTNKDDPAHFVIDVTSWLDAKEAAALCHKTQTPLFVRRRSEAAGRPLTVRDVLLTREGLHCLWPASDVIPTDAFAQFLRTECADVFV